MAAFIGIVCGIAIGLGLALRITVLRIKQSNDMGDSKGDMRDFGTYVDMMDSEDGMSSYRPSQRGKIMLEANRKKVMDLAEVEQMQ